MPQGIILTIVCRELKWCIDQLQSAIVLLWNRPECVLIWTCKSCFFACGVWSKNHLLFPCTIRHSNNYWNVKISVTHSVTYSLNYYLYSKKIKIFHDSTKTISLPTWTLSHSYSEVVMIGEISSKHRISTSSLMTGLLIYLFIYLFR